MANSEWVRLDTSTMLRLDEGNMLFIANGSKVMRTWAIRCFPLSDPLGPVGICDDSGQEIAFIPRLDQAPEGIRALLEKYFSKADFLPQIKRILSIVPATFPCTWHVETDKGATTFLLESENAIRRLPPRRLLITSSSGVRFLVADVKKLDRQSRRFLQKYL